MIYFIHLHHVTSRYVRVRLLGQRLGETLLWRFGVQFYSTPLQKMERGIVIQQPNVLGRSSRIRWSISRQPSSDFRAVRPYRLRHLLCPDRGNDVKTAKHDSLGLNTHELMHALINIAEQFHKQGVRRVVFGSLFLRHHSVYNKRCNRLNKLLRKHARCE